MNNFGWNFVPLEQNNQTNVLKAAANGFKELYTNPCNPRDKNSIFGQTQIYLGIRTSLFRLLIKPLIKIIIYQSVLIWFVNTN